MANGAGIMANDYQALYDNQEMMRQVANNLFNNTECNYLALARIEINQKSVLTTNADWISYLYRNSNGLDYSAILNYVNNNEIPTLSNNHYFLITGQEYDHKVVAAQHGINSIAMLASIYENYIDILAIGSEVENYAIDLIMHNPISVVKMKNEATSKCRKFLLKNNFNNIKGREYLQLGYNMPHNIEKFNKNCDPSHYYIPINGKECTMTAGEFKAIRLLAKGQTHKQAANELNISVSTVDEHLANTKERFGGINKSALLNAFNHSDLSII